MQTPWGQADHTELISKGIVFYTTPSHGGFKLDAIRNNHVHPAFRNDDGWYEEDCEALKVIFTFPQFFNDDFVRIVEGLRRWFPKACDVISSETKEELFKKGVKRA